MQAIIETPNLGPVTVSQHVVKQFSKLCNGDIDEALAKTEEILKDPDMERLDVPAMIASLMTAKGDDPNILEFWVHHDSSTVFMVKPQEDARLVEMAMKQSMPGFKFDID
jgi:hypothetical protein